MINGNVHFAIMLTASSGDIGTGMAHPALSRERGVLTIRLQLDIVHHKYVNDAVIGLQLLSRPLQVAPELDHGGASTADAPTGWFGVPCDL